MSVLDFNLITHLIVIRILKHKELRIEWRWSLHTQSNSETNLFLFCGKIGFKTIMLDSYNNGRVPYF